MRGVSWSLSGIQLMSKQERTATAFSCPASALPILLMSKQERTATSVQSGPGSRRTPLMSKQERTLIISQQVLGRCAACRLSPFALCLTPYAPKPNFPINPICRVECLNQNGRPTHAMGGQSGSAANGWVRESGAPGIPVAASVATGFKPVVTEAGAAGPRAQLAVSRPRFPLWGFPIYRTLEPNVP